MPRVPLAEETEQREAQLAALTQERNLAWWMKFSDAHATCYIQSKSFCMNRFGDWEFTVCVPREDYENVARLSRVVGMPIEMYITRGGKAADDDD